MATETDSITVFLAHLSLNPSEASAYLNDPVAYLTSGTIVLKSDPKKNVLKTKDKLKIDAAIADEQKGAIRGVFSFDKVVYAVVSKAPSGQGKTESS
jgi:hypothetical protein